MSESSSHADTPRGGILAYMARNHVAASVVMLTFLIGGSVMALFIRQETYPAYELDVVAFSMSYPGASPEEVEEGIILAVEEEVRNLQAVKRMVATASEGRAEIRMEIDEGFDPNRALQDVKNAIDRVSSFPDDIERPTVELMLQNRPVITIGVYGDLDESSLFRFSEKIRNDLLSHPEISQVEVRGGRNPEISIEVPQAVLRSLGLTLREIAEVIRENALDVPGGGIRAKGGEVLLRTSERREIASEYLDIPLISTKDGSKVRLGDVARIVEGFEDVDRSNRFNGQPGVMVSVYQTESQAPLDIARVVRNYIQEVKPTLPEKAGLQILWNTADEYQDRLNLLLSNGSMGLVLVLVVLGLFLAPRLAFWVAMGIPVAIIGSLLVLPALGATINMISLFAFIVTLGMVVDDAIIVGENVFYKMQQGLPTVRATIEGTREMVVPVTFAVATNIIAFLPLMFVPGMTGRFFAALPVVVIVVFLISFTECLLVLPAHLSRARFKAKEQSKGNPLYWLGRLQVKTSSAFDWFTDHVFAPFLAVCLQYRYLTFAAFFAALMVAAAYYQSGRINFTFDPSIESNRVDAEVLVPFGASFEETQKIANHVEEAGMCALRTLGGEHYLEGRMNIIGRRYSNGADVNFILVPPDKRPFTAAEFTRVWREEVGEIPGLESLYFEYEVGPSGSKALTIELAHPDRETLESAANELAKSLETYSGVTDVDDGFAAGKPQIDFNITAEGRSLGVTANDLGRQVRSAYYGAEALRLQRGRNEVKVMVRLPAAERESLHDLEELIVRTPDGGELPLTQAADLSYGVAYTEIERVNGKRVLEISANLIPGLVNLNKLREELEAGPLPHLVANHAGLTYSFEGRQREEREAMASLKIGLAVSQVFIFALVAALFRSYIQGLVIMLCIPFAVAAAMFGHVLMGYDLSIVSVFGMLALTGVAVNGAIVLTETIVDLSKGGIPYGRAVFESGKRRFRPIMLTSLTTFFGLAPMILETSTQAKFLVPMAISIGFGVLFSSVVVLFQTLATHLIVDDISRAYRRLLHDEPLHREEPVGQYAK